ncbi:AsnC family protein [Actinocrispum sp. NPDC049592]|uniref:AsnC family protein n=1 Tax=Actinocrispum sp. NPDC049592 TaxID=3154835 RepID=UPI003445AA88
MVAPDPVDIRLLSLIAEVGRAAVHEVAARLGMDPREVASRLVALSANGLPLIVGVECDPNGIRAALAAVPQAPPPPPPAPPSGPYHVPSGQYPPPPTPPSGPYPVAPPSGPYQMPPQQQAYRPAPPPPSHPFPAQPQPQPHQPQPLPPPDPVLSTWGPPQSASWARGDQPPHRGAAAATTAAGNAVKPTPIRTGKVGGTLETEGLEGEHLSIQLVEVVDPADFLFTAAGYRLQPGERSVVVHTEMVNKGGHPFNSLPDLYLVLVAKDGQTITKAPVSLSSRPPHRIGVAPGETAGGHTVYVLPENQELTAVRWSPRPDDTTRTLTWTVEQ